MKTRIIVVPFAQFGSPGAAQGAELLADAMRELIDDVQGEQRTTRSRAFRDRVQIQEVKFDTPAAINAWRRTTRRALDAIDPNDFVLWIGGNHLSVLPVYESMADRGASVVQFDAHLDLYNLDDSKKELNHGNFLRHARKLPPIVNVGHRDLFMTHREIHKYFASVHSVSDLATNEAPILAGLREWTASVERVFIDLDCDVLDPAFFPATAHPLPFGMSPETLLRTIDTVWSERVSGVAISEFDPGRDRDERSLQLLVWLIEWILLKCSES